MPLALTLEERPHRSVPRLREQRFPRVDPSFRSGSASANDPSANDARLLPQELLDDLRVPGVDRELDGALALGVPRIDRRAVREEQRQHARVPKLSREHECGPPMCAVLLEDGGAGREEEGRNVAVSAAACGEERLGGVVRI